MSQKNYPLQIGGLQADDPEQEEGGYNNRGIEEDRLKAFTEALHRRS